MVISLRQRKKKLEMNRKKSQFSKSLFSFIEKIQPKVMTSHFSSTFSICLVTIGFRIRILISTWPPIALRPSISAKLSCKTHDVSRACNLTCAVPSRVSLRRNPPLSQTSTFATFRLKILWQDLSFRLSGMMQVWLYSGLLVSFTTTVRSLNGVSFGYGNSSLKKNV